MTPFVPTHVFDVLRLAGDHAAVLALLKRAGVLPGGSGPADPQVFEDPAERLFAAIALGDLGLAKPLDELMKRAEQTPELETWHLVEQDLLLGVRGAQTEPLSPDIAALLDAARDDELSDPLHAFVAARGLRAEGLRIRKSLQRHAIQADEAYAEARRIFRRIARRDGVAETERDLGQLCAWSGDPSAVEHLTLAMATWQALAAQFAPQAAKIREAHGLGPNPAPRINHHAAATLYEIGMAFHDRGQYAQAAEAFEAAEHLFHPGAAPAQWARLHQARASSLIELGQLDEAARLLEDPSFATAGPFRELVRRRDQARIAVLRRDFAGARAALQQVPEKVADKDPARDFGARTLRVQQIRVAAADPKVATEAALASELERLAGWFQAAREAPHAIRAWRDAAELHLQRGDRARGTEALDRARGLARAYGFDALLRELRVVGQRHVGGGLRVVDATGGREYLGLGVLGGGGQGHVRLAVDRATGREVALKVSHGADDDRSIRTEVAILEALRGLRSSGLPVVYDVGVYKDGDEPERVFLAREIVYGRTVGELIEASREGDGGATEEAVRVVAALARTVQQIHDAGIVHADVKPDNVVVRPERGGEPVLIDFGLARREGEQGPVRCTPRYAAPEQLRREQLLGRAADVFALGAILLEWAGREPLPERAFAEGGPVAAGYGDLAALVVDRLVEPLAGIAAKTLAYAPEDRGTAGDVAAALSTL